MDVTGSMHGPTISRDDRYVPPRRILDALAAKQAEKGAHLTRNALEKGILFDKAAVDKLKARRKKVFASGSKRPRDGILVVSTEEERGREKIRGEKWTGEGTTGEMDPPHLTAADEGSGSKSTKHTALMVAAPLDGDSNTSGGDHRGYFEARAAKLMEQAEKPRSDLFKGMNVYLNGRTGELTAYHVQRLICRHGGGIALAPGLTAITHILAENLNGSKVDKFLKRAGARAIPILHPNYIADCIKAKRRLPETDYWTIRDSKATRIDNFYGPPVPVTPHEKSELANPGELPGCGGQVVVDLDDSICIVDSSYCVIEDDTTSMHPGPIDACSITDSDVDSIC